MFFKSAAGDTKSVPGEKKEAPAAPRQSIAQLSLDKLRNIGGRINLQVLVKLAHTNAKKDFAQFMKRPTLIGASIRAGSLSSRPYTKGQISQPTTLFKAGQQEEALMSESLQQAVYPLMKPTEAGRMNNSFTVGRVHENDLVMPDITISKRHAILQLDKDHYSLRDCGSTNGTKLNGNKVDQKPRTLTDGDLIAFARYEFYFLSPEALYQMLIESCAVEMEKEV